MKVYYLPTVDGRPAAWEGDQLAFCDDVSYWQDPPHRGSLYVSLPALKKHIEASRVFREKHNTPLGRYGWIEVVEPSAPPTTRREHELKVWPSFYAAIRDGSKRFEVRSTQDRDFAVGDTLLLREWDPHEANANHMESMGYTGRAAQTTITYIMLGGKFGVDAQTTILGFSDPKVGSFYDDEFFDEEPEAAE